MINQTQYIDWIAIFTDCSGNEAVVAWAVQRRVEHTIQPEDAEIAIVFVFVSRFFFGLDDHANGFRTLWPRTNL